jgi:hypothetical protein
MEGLHPAYESGEFHPAGLDDEENLLVLGNLPLPAINRDEARHNIHTGSQPLLYQGMRDLLADLPAGARHQDD